MSELDPPGYNEDEDSDFEPGKSTHFLNHASDAKINTT